MTTVSSLARVVMSSRFDRSSTRSGSDCSGIPARYALCLSANRFGWTAYLGAAPTDASPPAYAAASRCGDLTGLPPTWIGVGDVDLFHAEDVEYAARLTAAGVPCELVVVPGMYHGADVLRAKVPAIVAFEDSWVTALRVAVGAR